jgi:putative hemolysin
MILTLQLIAVFILIMLGGFFSGSETGVYRLSRFRLRLGVERSRPMYKMLSKIMADSQGLVFAILIGNNLVNYLATTTVTVIILNTKMHEQAAFYATLLMTPILFTFSEVIPKNIFYYRSDTLMPRIVPALWLFNKLFVVTGAVWLLKIISHYFTRLFGSSAEASTAISASRAGQIKQIVHETREEGILSTVQNDIINRLLKMPDINIALVMTPISETEMISLNSDRGAVLKMLRRSEYTHLPVYESTRSNIIGFIRIYDVLAGDSEFKDLRKFVIPLETFTATTPVIEAMNNMRKQNLKIVLVTGQTNTKHKKTPRALGIVTMKDLVEELTGELAQW